MMKALLQASGSVIFEEKGLHLNSFRGLPTRTFPRIFYSELEQLGAPHEFLPQAHSSSQSTAGSKPQHLIYLILGLPGNINFFTIMKSNFHVSFDQ